MKLILHLDISGFMPKVYLSTGHKTERVKYDSIDISGKFIQVYDDLYTKLLRIKSPCAIHLLFWMASNMGSYNQIVLNKNARSEFIAVSHGSYKDQTVKSAIQILIRHELIVSMNEKGQRDSNYFVNPFHFWRTGSQKDRAESIKGFIYKISEMGIY